MFRLDRSEDVNYNLLLLNYFHYLYVARMVVTEGSWKPSAALQCCTVARDTNILHRICLQAWGLDLVQETKINILIFGAVLSAKESEDQKSLEEASAN